MLQKQIVNQPFLSGIDTKTDPRLVRHPKLLKLENATLQDTGRIQKRNGHELAGNFDSGEALFAHNGGLYGTDGRSFYAFDSTSGVMSSVGTYTDVKVTAEKVSSGAGDCTGTQIAECDDFGVIAWIDSVGGAYFSTYDKTTGAPISTNQLLRSGATKVMAFGLDSRCVVLVQEGNELLAVPLDAASTASTISQTIVNLGGAPTIHHWTACAIEGDAFNASFPDERIVFLCAEIAAGVEVYAIGIDSNGDEVTSSGGWFDRAELYASGVWGIGGYYNCGAGSPMHLRQVLTSGHAQYGSVHLGWMGATSDAVISLWYSGGVVKPMSAWKKDTDNTSWVGVGSYGGSGGNDDQIIMYRQRYSDNYPALGEIKSIERFVYANNATAAPSLGAESTYLSTHTIAHSSSVVSEPFKYDGEDFIIACDSTTAINSTYYARWQKSYYLLSCSRTIGDNVGENYIRSPILARWMYTLGAHNSSVNHLQAMVSGDKVYCALPYNQRVEKVSQSNTRGGSSPGYTNIDYYTSVSKVVLDFGSNEKHQSAVLGDNLHLGGGMVQNFDGKELAEHGFLEFPRILNVVVSSGSTLPAGTYLYKAMYEWVDSSGQIHRSSPSPTYTAVLAGSRDPVLTIVKPHLTNRVTLDRVKVVVYRTTVGGSDIFYRVGSTAAFPDSTDYYVSYTDTVVDATIASNEILYTAGGEYENDSPPCASSIAVAKNRLWCVDEWGDVWFSKEWRRGESVGFSLLLQKTIPQFGGRPTAIASLDDKILIFKENKIFGIAGDGPQPNGENDTFSLAFEFPNKVGCSNPRSIVECDAGLLFKSNKGIYLFTRNGEAGYAGAGVHAYNDLNIVRAVSLPGKNQVRFYTSDGATLVYDYEQVNENGLGNWSTFTNTECNDAVYHAGTVYLLRSTGAIWKENTSFVDIATPIELKVQTGWMAFTGVQGWKRIYKVLLLGEKQSDHTLNMSFAYNYEDTEYQTVSFDTTALDGAAYGEGVFGVGSYGGEGDGDIYQFRVSPARQQCTSFRVTIWDSGQSGTYESMTLTDLSVEVGVTQNSTKLSSGRSG